MRRFIAAKFANIAGVFIGYACLLYKVHPDDVFKEFGRIAEDPKYNYDFKKGWRRV